MRRSLIERIRDNIRLRRYDMTIHALEEMAEDDLTIHDIEQAVLSGHVVEAQRNDPRGTKHVVQGTAKDGSTLVGVVGRFPSGNRYLIITVYKV